MSLIPDFQIDQGIVIKVKKLQDIHISYSIYCVENLKKNEVVNLP